MNIPGTHSSDALPMSTPSVLVVIPARYASTRFPGKPLADLHGKPMIQHVWERCVASPLVGRVLVATDDERIADAVRAFGGACVMTPEDLASGSERVAWVAARETADIVVNVQGDEPLLPPATIAAVIEPLLRDAGIDIGTAACPLPEAEAAGNPNVVKVVLMANGRALYFSRARVPHVRDGEPWSGPWLKHIGIYAFRSAALARFAALPAGVLEQYEKLEQLRALEHGMSIHVALVAHDSQAVDTPSDLDVVRALME